jgi:hypothetical protein
MHLVPPTPAMPRFAETSMLMSTQPIFGDITLDEDDWMEPPTPGPSRLLPPKSVKRSRQFNDRSCLAVCEENWERGVLGEQAEDSLLTALEERVLIGRGERVVMADDLSGANGRFLGTPDEAQHDGGSK